jgi:hypothetical protein
VTTFEHGKAPAWACATWKKFGEYLLIYEGEKRNGAYATEPEKADRLCRALSLAKLAEDWAAADRECDAVVARLEDLFIEHPESIAAGKRVDAARELLLKACAE